MTFLLAKSTCLLILLAWGRCNGDDVEDLPVIRAPVIDFSSLTYDLNSVPYELFAQIEDALINHGAFVAVNHPVKLEDQGRAFTAASALFDLPMDSKQSLLFDESNHFGRGYLSFGAESGLSANFEPKEGYSYGHPKHQKGKQTQSSVAASNSWLTSPNVWPATWTSNEIQPFNDLYENFSSLAELFLSYVVHARKVHRNKTTNIMVAGGAEISVLRLFHYFPLLSPLVQEALAHSEHRGRSQDRILGSSPHTDWGLLTIILQNSVTGLQYRKQNAWIDVPYIPGSLIFNCGDYFSLATQGDYHSPVHRVLSPQTQERLSFVYFFYPHYDSPLTSTTTSSSKNHAKQNNGKEKQSKVVVQADGEVQQSDNIEYNTLTVLDYEKMKVTDYDSEHTEKFGDYIIKKWRGVYRG